MLTKIDFAKTFDIDYDEFVIQVSNAKRTLNTYSPAFVGILYDGGLAERNKVMSTFLSLLGIKAEDIIKAENNQRPFIPIISDLENQLWKWVVNKGYDMNKYKFQIRVAKLFGVYDIVIFLRKM